MGEAEAQVGPDGVFCGRLVRSHAGCAPSSERVWRKGKVVHPTEAMYEGAMTCFVQHTDGLRLHAEGDLRQYSYIFTN